jgi:hypothetical protein
MGRRTTEEMVTPVPKVALLPAPISSLSTTLAMACANHTTFMATKPTNVFSLAPGQKNKMPSNLEAAAGAQKLS